MITAFLAAFGPVFLAELPDKTMFASLVLTTRTRRPLAVWSGVAAAFLMHVILAVAVGSLLRKLPTMPVRLGIAACSSPVGCSCCDRPVLPTRTPTAPTGRHRTASSVWQ